MEMDTINSVKEPNLNAGAYSILFGDLGGSLANQLYSKQYADLLDSMRQSLMLNWRNGFSNPNPSSNKRAGWISGGDLIRREFGVEPMADGVNPGRIRKAATLPTSQIANQDHLLGVCKTGDHSSGGNYGNLEDMLKSLLKMMELILIAMMQSNEESPSASRHRHSGNGCQNDNGGDVGSIQGTQLSNSQGYPVDLPNESDGIGLEPGDSNTQVQIINDIDITYNFSELDA